VVFELAEASYAPDVPVITGIERMVSSADSGKRLESASVSQAVFAIRQVKSSKALEGHRLTRVDTSFTGSLMLFFDPAARKEQPAQQALFVPEAGLKVKIGPDDVRQKLAVLATVLSQVSDRFSTIDYIDLRFREPVIKFKERM